MAKSLSDMEYMIVVIKFSFQGEGYYPKCPEECFTLRVIFVWYIQMTSMHGSLLDSEELQKIMRVISCFMG